ncbi:MAG: helix-turn-helix domain-containing protein [Balneola sp.]
MSQNEQVLEHLKEHGRITSLEAIDKYGITRLSGRIYDLKEEGHEICSRKVKVNRRDGSETIVAEYTLAGQMELEIKS